SQAKHHHARQPSSHTRHAVAVFSWLGWWAKTAVRSSMSLPSCSYFSLVNEYCTSPTYQTAKAAVVPHAVEVGSARSFQSSVDALGKTRAVTRVKSVSISAWHL